MAIEYYLIILYRYIVFYIKANVHTQNCRFSQILQRFAKRKPRQNWHPFVDGNKKAFPFCEKAFCFYIIFKPNIYATF